MSRTGPVTKNTSTIALGLAQIRVGKAASYIASVGSVLPAAKSIGALANTKYTGKVDYWKLESGFPMLEDLSLPVRESSSLECGFKELTSYNLAMARGIDPEADNSATAVLGPKASAAGTITGVIGVDDLGGVVTDTWTAVVENEAAGVTTFSVYGAVHGKVLASVTDAALRSAANGGNNYFTVPSGFFSGTWAVGDTQVFSTTAFVAGTAAYVDAHSGEIKLGGLKAPDYIRMEAVYTYPNGTNHMYIIFPRANVTSSMEIDLQAENNATVPITFEAKRADSEVAGGHTSWDTMPLGRIYFD